MLIGRVLKIIFIDLRTARNTITSIVGSGAVVFFAAQEIQSDIGEKMIVERRQIYTDIKKIDDIATIQLININKRIDELNINMRKVDDRSYEILKEIKKR
jgi:hypothetical protein